MESVISFVNGILWERNVLVWMLIGAGLFFSIKTKFVQLRLLKHMISLVRENNEGKSEGITTFQAFCISLHPFWKTANYKDCFPSCCLIYFNQEN